MKFIQLTHKDLGVIGLNADTITTFKVIEIDGKSYTAIYTTFGFLDQHLTVEESLDQILEMLK